MKIPSIIFSFIVKCGSVLSAMEHESLECASKYVGFKAGTGIHYSVETDSGSDYLINAKWIVNFKSKKPNIEEIFRYDTIGNRLVKNALKMVLRERKISKILDNDI